MITGKVTGCYCISLSVIDRVFGGEIPPKVTRVSVGRQYGRIMVYGEGGYFFSWDLSVFWALD
jgi:hypothetical protein